MTNKLPRFEGKAL